MSKENAIFDEKAEKLTEYEDFLSITGGAVGGGLAFNYSTLKYDLLAILLKDPKYAILCGLAEIGITVAGSVVGGLTGKYIGKSADNVQRRLKN